jgi:AraC-like DNA-binding protein
LHQVFDTSLQAHAATMTARDGAIHGDAAMARRHLSAITGGRCTFRVSDARRTDGFRSAQARLGATAFQVLRWEFDSDCQTSTERFPDQHVVFHLVLKGQFEAVQSSLRRRVREGYLLAASSPGVIVREWHGPCDLVNIVVPRRQLVQCLAGESQVDVDDISFDPLALVDLSEMPTLVSFLDMMLADLASDRPAFAGAQLASSAERMLSLLLLRSIPHTHSRLLAPPASPAAPFYVRRAERYMAAHLGASIGMDELAAEAGVSPRTLYYGFRQYRRQTPMRYLKHLRLGRAREELLAARETGGKVSLIAARAGYPSASQFSKDYRARYGETPRATVLRGTVRTQSARRSDP